MSQFTRAYPTFLIQRIMFIASISILSDVTQSGITSAPFLTRELETDRLFSKINIKRDTILSIQGTLEREENSLLMNHVNSFLFMTLFFLPVTTMSGKRQKPLPIC